MRTISVRPIGPNGNDPDDIDGTIVDGVVALEQRITQAFRFRLGEWFIARHRGFDFATILGHRIPPALAATALANVVRDEGGAEILSLENMQYSLDRNNRTFSWSVSGADDIRAYAAVLDSGSVGMRFFRWLWLRLFVGGPRRCLRCRGLSHPASFQCERCGSSLYG